MTFDESTSAISSDKLQPAPIPSEPLPNIKETKSTRSNTVPSTSDSSKSRADGTFKPTSPFYPSMRFKPSTELKIGSDVRMEVPLRLDDLSRLYHSSSAPQPSSSDSFLENDQNMDSDEHVSEDIFHNDDSDSIPPTPEFLQTAYEERLSTEREEVRP